MPKVLIIIYFKISSFYVNVNILPTCIGNLLSHRLAKEALVA